jgi:hypothetical protein
MKKGIVGAILPIAALRSGQSLAQTSAPVNDTDYLSKETENPVTRQTTLPLRYEADFHDGADKLTKSTIELDQAVVPFRLNDDWSGESGAQVHRFGPPRRRAKRNGNCRHGARTKAEINAARLVALLGRLARQ